MPILEFLDYSAHLIDWHPSQRLRVTMAHCFYEYYSSIPEVNSVKDVTLEMCLILPANAVRSIPGFGKKAYFFWSDILERHRLYVGMTQYSVDLYFSELNDKTPKFTDDSITPGLTTDICLRFLTAAGYVVSISPQPSNHHSYAQDDIL